jgi:hypothetical protein
VDNCYNFGTNAQIRYLSISIFFVKKALNIYRIFVLIASGGAELAAGYLMAFKPETFFDNPSDDIISLAGSFAVGATTMGIYSIMLLFLRQRQAQLSGFAVLALYHAGIGITQTICGSAGIEATIFHGWLTLSLVGLMVYYGKNE